MGKETIKKHKGRMFLENTPGKFERMNTDEIRILGDRAVYGLAPIHVVARRRTERAFVDITLYTPMSVYMQQGKMPTATVMSFLWNTVRIAHECERYGLRVDHLRWDPSRIYVDANGVVTMIYWPITSLQADTNAAWGFYCLLGSLLFESGLSSALYNRYYQFFNKRTTMDMNALYYLVQDLMRDWQEKETKDTYSREVRHEREQIESLRKKRFALASAPWLEWEHTHQKLPLTKEKFYFGRDRQCDVDLSAYDGISRTHAVVFKKGNRWYVMDLGSRNGTYVQEMRLPPNRRVALENGFTLRMGTVLWRFHEAQSTQTVFIHQVKER